MCPSVPSFAADAHGLLLSARREGDIDRLLQGAPAAGAGAQQQRGVHQQIALIQQLTNACSATLTADLGR